MRFSPRTGLFATHPDVVDTRFSGIHPPLGRAAVEAGEFGGTGALVGAVTAHTGEHVGQIDQHRIANHLLKGNVQMPPITDLHPLDNATPSNSADVAEALNIILADSFALYVKTKNFHWHVSGPHFRDYHLLFDAQAVQILATTDVIAERVRKTGHATLRSIGEIARKQSITDNNNGFVDAADMLAELREDNLTLIRSLRDAKELADSVFDNATSAVIDEWTDEAEGRAWMLREIGGWAV